ncbi:MAG: hypothetical protein RRC34_16275 [Lentisphaeria bacterium]|nr:hypothetical protein [Lentisphaeria bacterium]
MLIRFFTVFLVIFTAIVTAQEKAAPAISKNSVLTLIVTPGATDAFPARLDAARRLGENLSPQTIHILCKFLDRPANRDTIAPGELNALKNDVLDILVRQSRMPADLGYHLIKMCNDEGHDAVWRDYCIQFLRVCHQRARTHKEQADIEKTLWAATDKNWSISGTALISLELLKDAVDQQKVVARGFAIASDDTFTTAARMTALQICANAGHKDILPVARNLAASNDSVPLRVAAIGAIGLLGEESDLKNLTLWGSSSDVRLKAASKAAMERIQGKTGKR